MKKIFAVITAVLALMAVSCQKELLDTVPTGAISTSVVWTMASLARNAVTGVYNEFYTLYTAATGGNGDSWRNMFEGYSSVMDIDKNWREHYLVIYGAGTPSSSDVANMFKFYYTIVFRANDVIAHIDAVPDMDAAEKSRLKSEALFLRAFAYYNLNVLWGSVPLYTDYISDSKKATAPRSSESEVWEQIIDDLTVCIDNPNLPDRYSAGAA